MTSCSTTTTSSEGPLVDLATRLVAAGHTGLACKFASRVLVVLEASSSWACAHLAALHCWAALLLPGRRVLIALQQAPYETELPLVTFRRSAG